MPIYNQPAKPAVHQDADNHDRHIKLDIKLNKLNMNMNLNLNGHEPLQVLDPAPPQVLNLDAASFNTLGF
jgi:hypothetical protein